MTEAVIVHTELSDSEGAGRELGQGIRDAWSQARPQALILFASPMYDYDRLLPAIHAACDPEVLVGCSSAGEFTGTAPRESTACAIALRSSELSFAAGIGQNLRQDRARAAEQLLSSFHGHKRSDYSYRTGMILTDALAGHADEFIEQLTLLTAGSHQFFGGGAGDDAAFQRTHVFHGTQAIPDAAVGLEILSNKPLGIGVCHGWEPASAPMRVTEADGMRLISLNAVSARDVFQEYAQRSGQSFDPAQPLSFFLHNVLGLQTGSDYKLRVPLQVMPDGSIVCAAEVPAGSTVTFMKATSASSAAAAATAVQQALLQLGNHRPQLAIVFDCVATRLRTGREFGLELAALQQALGGARFAGCNTYGQVARAEGQFGGFHNCTAVVAVLP